MDQVVNAAQRAAEAAARAVGINPAGMRLVRVGENVILLLPDAPAVARVASSVALLESVRRELRVASWLAEAGVPAVRALVAEPFVDGELVVSLWEYLPEVEATDVVNSTAYGCSSPTTFNLRSPCTGFPHFPNTARTPSQL
ncbi:MAG: phosphotransferase [Pseudonocardiaceae bacterium]